jgi:hypothetical protein
MAANVETYRMNHVKLHNTMHPQRYTLSYARSFSQQLIQDDGEFFSGTGGIGQGIYLQVQCCAINRSHTYS